MSEQDDVAALLAELRQAESARSAPPRVEAAVMAAWDTRDEPRRAPRFSIAARLLPLAAAAVLAVGLVMLGGRLRSEMPLTVGSQSDAALVLVGPPILADEPLRVVRMRMPAAVLRSLGVRSTAADADSIEVDVVIGEDSVARALRLTR